VAGVSLNYRERWIIDGGDEGQIILEMAGDDNVQESLEAVASGGRVRIVALIGSAWRGLRE
jgi:hypothetical protein